MSDDRGKSIATLRKKRTVRPKISGPLPAGLPSQGSQRVPERKPSSSRLNAPRPRPQQGDKTSDLVKRRYSTRYTQLQSDFGAGAPPVPSVPKVPTQYGNRAASSERRAVGSSDGPRIKVDPDALQDPSLKPEQCKHCSPRTPS